MWLTCLQTVLKVVAFCRLHCMSDDDGRGEKNRTDDDAHHDDGDEWSFEPDDVGHHKAANGESEEQVTDAVRQQVEMRDSFAACSHGVVLRVVHVIDGRGTNPNSTSGYRFVGSNRVRYVKNINKVGKNTTAATG